MSEDKLVICLVSLLLLLGVVIGGLCFRHINRKLNRQMKKTALETDEIRRRKKLQEAMLPSQLLSLFQNGDLEKVRLGEQKGITAAVLSFNVPDFSRWIRTKTAEEIFNNINHVLAQVVPCVLYQEGEIDRFVDAGLKAFFLKNPEKALSAAISICEAMDRDEEIRADFSIGLSYGDVMIGMVGDEKRFGILTISETTGVAEFLQEQAGQYGARILITGSMKKQIPGFEKKYNSRYIGNIRLKASGITEDLYDVFDGENPAGKNAKRKTKILFEKGVKLFQEKKFYDARLHFIEVLKANRMDGAAKKYLYLCNCYQEGNDDKEENTYLDVY